MEQPTHFRTAFNGFNREDVVRYLEFINNKNSAQVAQLNNELDYLRAKQDAPAQDDHVAELEAQNAALTEENEQLKQRIAELEAKEPEEPQNVSQSVPATVAELEAYRRAERVERLAKERAKQVDDKTTSVLQEAGAKVDGAATRIAEISNLILEQLNLLQNAMTDSHEAFEAASKVVADLHTEIED